MNEPVYAYHLLKMARSFMQNFLYKLDKADTNDTSDDSKIDFESHTLDT
jgi:hypothetical protein